STLHRTMTGTLQNCDPLARQMEGDARSSIPLQRWQPRIGATPSAGRPTPVADRRYGSPLAQGLVAEAPACQCLRPTDNRAPWVAQRQQCDLSKTWRQAAMKGWDFGSARILFCTGSDSRVTGGQVEIQSVRKGEPA